MSLEKPKYVKVTTIYAANEIADEYSLRTPIVYTHTDEKGQVNTDVEYLMSLREPNKYDDIEKYMRIPITSEEQTLPEGWEVIHHTSKELVIVKRGTDVDSVEEETE